MSACPTNKVPYSSRGEAKRVLRVQTQLAGAKGNQVYRCTCGYWHIGHRYKKQTGRKRAA